MFSTQIFAESVSPFSSFFSFIFFFAILLAIVDKLANVTVNSWAENRSETCFFFFCCYFDFYSSAVLHAEIVSDWDSECHMWRIVSQYLVYMVFFSFFWIKRDYKSCSANLWVWLASFFLIPKNKTEIGSASGAYICKYTIYVYNIIPFRLHARKPICFFAFVMQILCRGLRRFLCKHP